MAKCERIWEIIKNDKENYFLKEMKKNIRKELKECLKVSERRVEENEEWKV